MAEAEYIDRNLIEWYGCDFEDASCENRECAGCSHAECSHSQVMQIPTADVISIPRGATNGDMIKAMFDIPDSEIDEGLSTTYVYTSKRVLKGGSQDYLRKRITFSRDWWNAPYKGGCNLSEKSTGSESEE